MMIPLSLILAIPFTNYLCWQSEVENSASTIPFWHVSFEKTMVSCHFGVSSTKTACHYGIVSCCTSLTFLPK
jgi:hypothetical protein